MKAQNRPSYADIAGCISGQHNSPPWLSDFLKSWAGSLVLDRHVMQKQPGRAKVGKALSEAISAAQILEDLLDDSQLREFLEDPPFGPLEQREHFAQYLYDLQARAQAAFGKLSTSEGKIKPGRSRAMPQKAFPSKVFCALIISEAWKYIHGEYPAPRNKAAGTAAEMLWNSRPTELLQPPPGETVGWGSDPVEGWRPYFKEIHLPELDDTRKEIQRRLRTYERLSSQV